MNHDVLRLSMIAISINSILRSASFDIVLVALLFMLPLSLIPIFPSYFVISGSRRQTGGLYCCNVIVDGGI